MAQIELRGRRQRHAPARRPIYRAGESFTTDHDAEVDTWLAHGRAEEVKGRRKATAVSRRGKK